jgi:hypothetical protein
VKKAASNFDDTHFLVLNTAELLPNMSDNHQLLLSVTHIWLLSLKPIRAIESAEISSAWCWFLTMICSLRLVRLTFGCLKAAIAAFRQVFWISSLAHPIAFHVDGRAARPT